ncbi:hypothetical protein [Timonella senegalensis]|uniref:hypothetical protein n=1 Tax=Timonella senegalensis TaxID=1465825 RepID=UPI0012B63635|nr:hypothetical protein [Timonella senegalensis]
MTETAPEMEEAPVEGHEKAKPGTTLFSFAGFAFWGIIIGVVVGTIIYGSDRPEGTPIAALSVVAPMIVAIIQRTTSDKEVTWYKREARIAGLIAGFVATFIYV